jgi:hypothetical protein
MTLLERAQAQHKDAVKKWEKCTEARELSLKKLFQAQARLQQSVKEITRAHRKVQKIRVEEKAANKLKALKPRVEGVSDIIV